MDVVGLTIMRSQTTSYLSSVNSCRLTGLGRRQLIQFLRTCQPVFRSPLCDVSREIWGAFPQTCVYPSAQLNTRSTRNTLASCGNTIFTTLRPSKVLTIYGATDRWKVFIKVILFHDIRQVRHLGRVCTGAFESLRTLNSSLYIIIIIIIIIIFIVISFI